MGQDTKEILKNKKFKWSHVFSNFNAEKTREEKDAQIMAGLPGNVPYEREMIETWQPPFLFYRFFLYSFVMMALIFICSYMYGFGDSLIVCVTPYIIPMTLLLFVWELNIPRNISLPDILYICIFSGISCFLIIFFIVDITGLGSSEASGFAMPLLSAIAKFLLVCVFLRKKSRGYGLNGLLVGAAVGAGFSILATADDLFYLAEYAGQVTGVMGLIIVRILMAIGGDIVWTATVGGALALAKGKETLKGKHLSDSLFLICLIGTYLIEVLWDYDIINLFARFADSAVAVGIYRFLQEYQGKYILLTVVSWALFLFIARKGIAQAFDIVEKAKAEKRQWDSKIAANYAGKCEIFGIAGVHGGQKFSCTSDGIVFGRDSSCKVGFTQDSKGISSIHCEIKKQGEEYVLIDRNSTYGTFLSNGEKLTPGKPYILRGNVGFYLASEENAYKVSVIKNAKIPADTMQYGRRTNEIDGAEESGKNVYIACAAIMAVMFMAFYVTSGTSGLSEGVTEEQKSDGFYGAWLSDSCFDIKDIILSNIDNVVTVADIWIFRDSVANGITFTQDGTAYCTYNGAAIDYAQFAYSVVDDSTLHLQWSYVFGKFNLGIDKIVNAGVSHEVGDETGFDIKYSVNGNEMRINFAGQNLVMYK